jgi:hypothetical protein
VPEPLRRRGGAATRATVRAGGSLRDGWCGVRPRRVAECPSGGRRLGGARTAPPPSHVSGRESCGARDRADGPSRVAGAAPLVEPPCGKFRLTCDPRTALHIGCHLVGTGRASEWSVSCWRQTRCHLTQRLDQMPAARNWGVGAHPGAATHDRLSRPRSVTSACTWARSRLHAASSEGPSHRSPCNRHNWAGSRAACPGQPRTRRPGTGDCRTPPRRRERPAR